MKVVLLGVRGSTPAPGVDYLRYGGHTSALAVIADDEDRPSLVLDAGTGLRDLPSLLSGQAFSGDIVLSHLHWDHVQGLPFSPSLDHPEAHVRLHLPAPAGCDGNAEALLTGNFSPPYFPIGPSDMLGSWNFFPVHCGQVSTAGTALRVFVAPVTHKGGLTLGIRVLGDGRSFTYLPDHAMHSARSPRELAAAAHFVRGSDVLIHDGYFTAVEEEAAISYGHATIERTLEFADECAVDAVVLTHHAPSRTDAELEELAARFTRTPEGRPVFFGRQGETVTIGATIS